MIKTFVNTYILKTQVRKDALTLISGTAIAQIITLISAPILTRIYSPEQFGILALFMTISTILGTITTGRYEVALILPKDPKDAKTIFHVGFFINVIFSGIILILVIGANKFIANLVGVPEIAFWLYFLPIVVFMTGLYNLLNYYNTRLRMYKVLAQIRVMKSAFSSLLQIFIGPISSGVHGLMVGNIAGNFTGIVRLLQKVNNQVNLSTDINKTEMIKIAKKYSDFPKVSLLSILLNTVKQNITSLLMPTIFSVVTLGYYSFANKILGFPINFVGDSIKQVFIKKLSEARNSKGNAVHEFDITLKSLCMISIPAFTVLFFILVPLFEIVFGSKWVEAGVYAKILVPYFATSFISSNLSVVMSAFEKQKVGFLIQVFMFVTVISILFASKEFNWNVRHFLSIMSTVSSLEHLMFIGYYRRVAKG